MKKIKRYAIFRYDTEINRKREDELLEWICANVPAEDGGELPTDIPLGVAMAKAEKKGYEFIRII